MCRDGRDSFVDIMDGEAPVVETHSLTVLPPDADAMLAILQECCRVDEARMALERL
jgi:hypothetical protein